MAVVGNSFVGRCVSLALVVLIGQVAANEEICDRSKCQGPLRFYDDLGCQPIYENEGDCCPSAFNCDHLKGRSTNKCYVNGKAYDIGQALKEEDAAPCDLGCTCQENQRDGIARFRCAVIDCFWGPSKPNCYMRNSPDRCCPGPEVCLEAREKRPTCEVDGKIYQDGEYFKPKSNPELSCFCMPDYKGENVEPFCKKPNRPSCSVDFRHPDVVINKCAPVFYPTQNPATDCALANRCQTVNDTVIHTHEELSSSEEAATKTCHFGELELHIGDELKQIPGYDSQCVKCVCNLPPFVTCQRMTDDECKSSLSS